MKIVYKGKHANVAVGLPGGNSINAERDVPIEVNAATAKILKSMAGWSQSSTTPITTSEEGNK